MKRDLAEPVFGGFSAKAFSFLKELAVQQNRDWFLEHKSEYEQELKEPLSLLVKALGLTLRAKRIDLECDPKRAIFRINRDIRFSKDKRPYKTNVGAAMTRNGDKNSPGVLYIHIDPAGSFTASGFYCPESPQLQAIRQQIVDRPKEFLSILNKLAKAGFTLAQQDRLQRLPRGFETVESPEIGELLRLKSLVVIHPLPKKTLGDGPALIKEISDFAVTTHPLLQFGWTAVTL